MNSFENLTPEFLLSCLEEQGFSANGQVLALNSYENRVFKVGLLDQSQVIVKFYRPDRHTLYQICEEHDFLNILLQQNISVNQPLLLKKPVQESDFVSEQNEFFMSVFSFVKGREHSELIEGDRYQLGQILAKIHNSTEIFSYQDREELNAENIIETALDDLWNSAFVSDENFDRIEPYVQTLKSMVVETLIPNPSWVMCHGDLHLGNMLWQNQEVTLVDFDDSLIAPPVQDAWMLFHGNLDDQNHQREEYLKGYQKFREPHPFHLKEIEALRALRIIKHSAWIAKRFHEEIFSRNFSYFSDQIYWDRFALSLKEQISHLIDPN
jgi:Ser/Thr protein kinase RdoA (MazF antagonist)